METSIPGAFVIEIEPIRDHRGFFARTFSEDEFRAAGLDAHVAQCSVSFNPGKATLRGMHYQAAPHAQSKLVRCTMGAIHDVIVDLRPESATFRRWLDVELTAGNRRLLYVPPGCGHGFITLTDDVEVFYQMGGAYVPGSERGVRWNDPAFAIRWPAEPAVISERDAHWPLWSV